MTPNELAGYWSAFIGARPQAKAVDAPTAEQAAAPKPAAAQQQSKPQAKKRKYPFVDICSKWNTGNCQKAAGACYNFRGIPMRHCCNWRDPAVQNAQPCTGNHQRVGFHP